MMVPRIILILLLTGYACLAAAETAFIEATKDNTLYESPSGLYSNGMGNHILVGETVDLLKRRAVIAFTELDAIPAGSTVMSVKLHLYLSAETSDATIVDLKRLTSNWGRVLQSHKTVKAMEPMRKRAMRPGCIRFSVFPGGASPAAISWKYPVTRRSSTMSAGIRLVRVTGWSLTCRAGWTTRTPILAGS